MKAMARMAALAAALAFVSGCSHGMRHTNPQLKDQVKLPAAPMIEPSTSAPAGPGCRPRDLSPSGGSARQRAALIARAVAAPVHPRENRRALITCLETSSILVPGRAIHAAHALPAAARVIRSRTRGGSWRSLRPGGKVPLSPGLCPATGWARSGPRGSPSSRSTSASSATRRAATATSTPVPTAAR